MEPGLCWLVLTAHWRALAWLWASTSLYGPHLKARKPDLGFWGPQSQSQPQARPAFDVNLVGLSCRPKPLYIKRTATLDSTDNYTACQLTSCASQRVAHLRESHAS
jgi:hypothetical protein